ncbi:glycoside hydrolase family 16 protein [Biscogniauxia sp. FL1348]|nr:glycoside hydrolase family 16 protein [Biscogniauxia sp. FL1348]
MAYSLSTHYAGQGLLDSFSFFMGDDPSNGFVDYQSRDAAVANNLVAVDEFNRVRLGVDSTNTYSISDKGRPSVRLTSNDDFTHGLFIADFAHMPASSCGTWPAFWAFNNQDDGEDWPVGGELDIIEGANTAQRNLFSAHTADGCKAPRDVFIGVQGETDCSPDLNNFGCNYLSPTSDATSYGDAFNAEGGGVYALEWTSDDLKIWHFPRSAIPDDIAFAPVSSPDPSTWGAPQARFGGSSCDPDTYFFNMSLVINTNFCGAYAGQTWNSSSQCSTLAPSCEAYVAGNPGSFKGVYWDINYIDVYQLDASPNMTVPSVPPITTSIPQSTMTSIVSSVDGSVTGVSTRTITLTTKVTAAAQPTQSGGGLTDPSRIGAYTLIGCFGSSAGYQAFTPIASLPNMDIEACVASCAGRKYAGVSGENCYCADMLGDASALSNDMCDTPCPGNGLEFCGGVLDAGEAAQLGFIGTNAKLPSPRNSTTNRTIRAHRRAAPSDVLLTVYADIAADTAEAPAGAPAMGGDAPTPVPSNATTAITVTYTTVCATNPALLVEAEYRTTVTYEDCGCTRTRTRTHAAAAAPITNLVTPTVAAVVPMTTCTETCRGCGPHGESTVTLTIPSAVYATHEVVVTAVAVQTVVPLVVNATLGGSSGNITLPVSNGTVVPPSVAPPLPPSVPAHGAASGLRSITSWGLGLWIGVLGLSVL